MISSNASPIWFQVFTCFSYAGQPLKVMLAWEGTKNHSSPEMCSHTTCVCRLQRDLSVRGRDVAGVLQQYTKYVKPAHDTFVAPSRRSADVIIPWARCAWCCGLNV